jgi:hypothetical protein
LLRRPAFFINVRHQRANDANGGNDDTSAESLAGFERHVEGFLAAKDHRHLQGWTKEMVLFLADADSIGRCNTTLAALVVSAVEGAVALCRATRSSRPLKDVQLELRQLLAAALPREALS